MFIIRNTEYGIRFKIYQLFANIYYTEYRIRFKWQNVKSVINIFIKGFHQIRKFFSTHLEVADTFENIINEFQIQL